MVFVLYFTIKIKDVAVLEGKLAGYFILCRVF